MFVLECMSALIHTMWKAGFYMNKFYRLDVAGLNRELKLFPVNEKLYIAAFILFGDVELTEKCAEALLKKAPDFDIMITAESKGIPLIYEMARKSGRNNYIVARKGPKVYMEDILFVNVNSITTTSQQMLCLGKKETDLIKGRRVLIVDDVISTGESLAAIETLVEKAGGTIAGKMAVLAEGDAVDRKDIIYLSELPLFNNEGSPI